MAVITSIADVHTRWYGPEVMEQVRRNVGAGVRTAAIFLTARMKELVSVPAPRKYIGGRIVRERGHLAIVGKRVRWVPARNRRVGGKYVATVPATAYAPPRKLSGALRRSITWQAMDNWNLRARVGTNIAYGSALEFNRRRRMKTTHAFLWPTVEAHRTNLQRIIGYVSITGSP